MRSSTKVIIWCAALSACHGQTQSFTGTGSLQGSVADSQGKPIAGAVVRYHSIPDSVQADTKGAFLTGKGIQSGTVTADSNGKFALAGLPAGTHSFCVNLPSAPYLDPCIWRQPVQTRVSSGAAVTQLLVLEKGVYLKIRINDPLHLLPQTVDGPWTPRKLQVGVVYGTGAYHGVMNNTADSTGRTYQTVIPAGQPFTLWLYSTDHCCPR